MKTTRNIAKRKFLSNLTPFSPTTVKFALSISYIFAYTVVCLANVVVILCSHLIWIFSYFFGLFSSEVLDVSLLRVYQGSVEYIFVYILYIFHIVFLFAIFTLYLDIVSLPPSTVKLSSQWPDFSLFFHFLISRSFLLPFLRHYSVLFCFFCFIPSTGSLTHFYCLDQFKKQ